MTPAPAMEQTTQTSSIARPQQFTLLQKCSVHCFIVVTIIVKIEFDRAKHISTLENQGLDMAQADEIFAGNTITVEDDRMEYGEKRFITVGLLKSRMVILVWTPRGEARRIISMRKANAREQKIYKTRLV